MRPIGSAVLSLAVVLGGGLMPPAVARSGSGIHELRGVTHFTTTKTSSTLVRFPKAIDFGDFSVSHRGNGRVRGFILRKVGDFRQEGLRPIIDSVNIGMCAKRGCKARDVPYLWTCFECGERLSGVWELYVIADGAPVTVTFKLKGIAGRSRSTVKGPVRSELGTLEPQVHEEDGDRVFSAGAFTELDQADFGFFGLWVGGDPFPAGAVGECIYREGGAFHPPEDMAFTPGCPVGHRTPFFHVNPDLGPSGHVLKSVSHCCAPGLGGWYATAATVKRYGAVVLWIDF